jgi:hypothetical protein
VNATKRLWAGIVLAALAAAGLEAAEGPAEKRVALDIKLPPPLFIGTRKDIKLTPQMEPPPTKPRPAFLVPEGLANVALKKPVTSSDDAPVVGELAQITDGNKEGQDGCYVELGPGRQWVQIDLQAPCRIYAILVWHYHAQQRLYRDVVVQVADDADFITNVRTVFNNDYDNSSGLGIGKDLEYFETHEGRLIDAKGEAARYVRLYSKGSTDSDLNHYIEVEVHGKPAK